MANSPQRGAVSGVVLGHGSEYRQLRVLLVTGQETIAVLPTTRKFGCLFGSLVGWNVKIALRKSPKLARVVDLARPTPTVEYLRLDPEYRFSANVTDTMTTEELWTHLQQEAAELDRVNEAECSYGIYREMVWRFPNRPAAWEGLAKYAAKMSFHDEARIAQSEAERLVSMSRLP